MGVFFMATSKSRRKQKNQLMQANALRSQLAGNGWYLTAGYHAADTKRDVWEAVGYPKQIDFDKHWSMANRQGVAKAGIHRIVNKCWQDSPTISDGEYEEGRQMTPFERDVEELINKHRLFQRLKGLDWRNRIGRYSGIIPIVKERSQNSPDKPISMLGGVASIIKLVPVFESQIEASEDKIRDFNSVNFGNPEYFNFRDDVPGDRNPNNSPQVELHPSRLFVFAEGADDGSIYGVPANEAGFNSLLDMEKSRGSGAEGLYKNAKQRTVYNVKDGQTAQQFNNPAKQKNGKTAREQLDETVDDFDSGNSASVMLYGMEASTLQATIADPTHPWTIALNDYCASIECPATILIGQQTGRLASDEDQKDWALTAQSRCNNVLTPMITDFLSYLIDIGAIAKPTREIVVTWPDFIEPAPSEKLDTANKMADINKKAFDSGRGQPVFTDEEVRDAAGYDTQTEGELDDFQDDEGMGTEQDPVVQE